MYNRSSNRIFQTVSAAFSVVTLPSTRVNSESVRHIFKYGCYIFALLASLLLQACQLSLSSSGGDEDSASATASLLAMTGPQITATEVIGTVVIAWSNDEPHRSTVDIYLSQDSGQSFPTVIADHAKDTGQYTWNTNTVSDCRACRLRIVTRDVVGNLSAPTESTQDFVINNVPQVLGSAIYADIGNNGAGDRDTITVPFDKELELRTGIASDVFIIPVLGDSIGAFATVAKGANRNELVITFNGVIPDESTHLHATGGFDPDRLHRTAPSGINVRNNLAEGVLFAPDTGRTAAPTSAGIDIAPGFSPKNPTKLPGTSRDIALGDVNGDGHLDLVTSFGGDGGGDHQVWLNTGTPATPFNTATPSQSLAYTASFSSIALGDVNGDGRLDLIVVSRFDPVGASLPHEVWLNTGNATTPFNTAAPSQLLTNGDYSASVAIGDVNGDGRADLFMGTGVSPGSHRVWLNTGSSTTPFNTGAPSLLLAASGFSVALGDVNGDGHLDLVAGVSNGDHQVWFNTGNAVTPFNAAPSQLLVNSADIQAIALGDANGDGRLDLVVTTDAAHQVWLNSGNAAAPFNTAAPSQTLLSTGSVTSVVLGDMDGDGLADLVVGYYTSYSGDHRLWRNSGDAAAPFDTVAPSQIFTSEEATFSMALGDVDGDGDADLVAGGFFYHRVFTSSARVPGRAVYVAPDNSLMLANSNSTTNSIGVVDVNGDGLPDLVMGSEYLAHQVWLNTGNTATPFSTVAPSQLLASGGNGGAAKSIALGDVNGDGRPDLLVGVSNGAHQVWLNTGNGLAPFSITAPSQSLANSVDTGSFPLPVALSDVNGDGLLDLIVGINNGAHQIWLNTGNASTPFNPGAPSQSLVNSADTRTIALGDVNGDGRPDLVVGTFGTNNQLWLNTGTVAAPFNTAAPSQLIATGGIGAALGDVNGDGRIDLVSDGGYGNHSVRLNTGSATTPFNAAPSQTLTRKGPMSSIAVADTNGDGHLDLLMTGFGGAHEVWLNTGNSTAPFNTALPSQLITGISAIDSEIALGDVDGDGDQDLVVGNYDISHKVWLNDY